MKLRYIPLQINSNILINQSYSISKIFKGEKMDGKVIFIGGGPGDPELLTLKAYNVIKKADVIIYAGSLVNKDVLSCARKDSVIKNSASMNLDQIVELMEESVKDGKLVARVHTGDPAIYGAIGEQIELLREKGIEFDIIPGVSSFFAAAASLECELDTSRGFSDCYNYTSRRPYPQTLQRGYFKIGRTSSHNVYIFRGSYDRKCC